MAGSLRTLRMVRLARMSGDTQRLEEAAGNHPANIHEGCVQRETTPTCATYLRLGDQDQ